MITVRDYHRSDYVRVRTTLEEVEMYDPVRDSADNLLKKIQLDPGSVIVAVDGKKAIGNVYAMYDGVFAFIFRLAVRKGYQKKGVGSLLLTEAENRLREKGAARISLWIREQELPQLHHFYQKRGYLLAEGKHQCMYKDLP